MNKCPNCSFDVKPGDVFCRNCGSKLPIPQNNFSNSMQPQTINNINSVNNVINQNNNNDIYKDDILIDSYIGKNANKLKTSNFSLNTFFLGFLYVLYRKMWLLGITWLVINIIANMFLKSIAGAITLLTNIIISTQFKKLYLKHVLEQVEKIKSENPYKTKEELMILCSKKGGTTWIPVIIALIIYGIMTFVIFSLFFDDINEYEDNYYYQDNQNKGSGTIKNLTVKIPSILKNNTYSSSYYKSFRTSYEDTDSCSLELSIANVSSYYNDAKTYLEKTIYYSASDNYSGISQKNINNNTWYFATVTTAYSQKYYYSIINGETIYKLEFSIVNDKNQTCSKAYDTVANSLRFS